MPGSTLFFDVGPGGQIALITQDGAFPGYGIALQVSGATLNGSPLPSNTIRFTRVRWSPDGQYVAFIAETPGARQGSPMTNVDGNLGSTISDGLWVWTTPDNPANQQTHHALLSQHAFEYGRDHVRVVNDFAWSPDSALLLVQLDPVGLALVLPGSDASSPLVVLPYETGSWSNDATAILVSGSDADGSPLLAWISGDTYQPIPLFRGVDFGLWMRDPVQLADGRIAFLGAPYNPDDPGSGSNSSEVGLYVYDGVEPRRAVYIGGGPVVDAAWNDRRTAVLVRLADGRTIVARPNFDGNVDLVDITATVGDGVLAWGE